MLPSTSLDRMPVVPCLHGIFYGAVARADMEDITIGAGTSTPLSSS